MNRFFQCARACMMALSALMLFDLMSAQAQQQPVSGESGKVEISFTALDKEKHFVTTLQKEDIRILENEVPQEIVAFKKESDLPLSLAILIDTSPSQVRTLGNSKWAVRTFVDSIVRQGKDQVAIATFTGDTIL